VDTYNNPVNAAYFGRLPWSDFNRE